MANFRASDKCEVPRIPLPRTPVNKGMKKGRGCWCRALAQYRARYRPLADLRFEDHFVGFQRLAGFEVVDLPPPLLEPLVEGIRRACELFQRPARGLPFPIDHGHLHLLGQPLEPHLLLADAQPSARVLILATSGPPDLFEDALGLLALAGLDELGEAINRHRSPSSSWAPVPDRQS